MAITLIHSLFLSLFTAIISVQFETAYASVVRGLKKDKDGCGSCKNDPTIVSFTLCQDLLPLDSFPVDFELEETCTTIFWENEAPWINGSPLYVAYYPACTCVILAKGCFLPAVSTFTPMYDVARSAGMSREEAIAFGTPFIHEECLAYALAFLDQWANDQDEDPHSND